MPTVNFFGATVRVRPMLDAIGAQQTFEAFGAAYRQRAKLAGPTAERQFERERMALAGRRNRAEGKLRPEEHAAWVRWRSSIEEVRAAGYALLTDRP